MKKGLYLIVVIGMIVLLCGCQKGMSEAIAVGSETKNIQSNTKLLKCTIPFNDDIPETEESSRSVEIFYQNYAISKVTYIFSYRLADKYAESAVTAIEQSIVTTIKGKYNKYAPIIVGTSRKGNLAFDITIEFEYTKLTKEEIEELQLLYAGDYSEDRRMYENSGYTCE